MCNLVSLVSASFILMVANYLSLPVSTTHTIVGSIIGFSIAAKGFESIKWKEVGKIIISWVASPALTGTMAIIFFYCTRRFILQSEKYVNDRCSMAVVTIESLTL
jgi:phosphate/sulfate permease